MRASVMNLKWYSNRTSVFAQSIRNVFLCLNLPTSLVKRMRDFTLGAALANRLSSNVFRREIEMSVSSVHRRRLLSRPNVFLCLYSKTVDSVIDLLDRSQNPHVLYICYYMSRTSSNVKPTFGHFGYATSVRQ